MYLIKLDWPKKEKEKEDIIEEVDFLGRFAVKIWLKKEVKVNIFKIC